jgi:ribosomal protein S18 acetylase RimI-like enzyme
MIRRATPEDAGRMADIHINGWRYAYRGIVSDGILFVKMNVENRTNALKKIIEEGVEEWYVLDDNEILKGILLIGASRDNDIQDAFEMWCIYVDHFMLREGTGNKLLTFCESEAAKRGFSKIILWVLEKNHIGKDFYLKNGFIEEGKSQFLENLKATEIRLMKNIDSTC